MSKRVCHALLVVAAGAIMIGLARTAWWVVMHL
jgi:hypothetical protein